MEILQEHRHGAGLANDTKKEETEEPMDEEKSIPQKRRRRLSNTNITDTLEPMYSR